MKLSFLLQCDSWRVESRLQLHDIQTGYDLNFSPCEEPSAESNRDPAFQTLLIPGFTQQMNAWWNRMQIQLTECRDAFFKET